MQGCTTPIFIVGAQRSGTTLLRLILNAHSQIAIPEEARFLSPLLGRKHLRRPIAGEPLRRVLRYIAKNPQFKRWNYDPEPFFATLGGVEAVGLRDLVGGLYSSFCASEGKSIWGDKSLFFRQIGVLHALFPDARFVHVIRDGRDVFDSWRRIEPQRNHAAVVAIDWRYKLRAIERALAAVPAGHRLGIRYEDLLARPEETIRAVCGLVGVAYESAMLEFYRTSRFYIGDHHSELIFGPIDPANVCKWPKRLSGREARVFTALARRRLRRHGYPTDGPGLGFADVAWMLRDLATALPGRAWEVARTRLLLERAVRRGAATEATGHGEMPALRRAAGTAAMGTSGTAPGTSAAAAAPASEEPGGAPR